MQIHQIHIRHDETEDRLLLVAKTDWDISLGLHQGQEPLQEAAPRRLN